MGADPADWTPHDLREHLQAAVELELLVIPPYLCGLYSLHPDANEEAALIIRSVVVEEMLHLTLAANVLNAVGGAPRLVDGGWIPRYPARIPYHRGPFEVGLLPFGEAALETFLAIENPSYPVAAPPDASPNAALPRVTTLADEQNYATVGEFYDAIKRGLEGLVARLGEKEVFTGDAGRQVGPEEYYASGGHVIEVRDLDTALSAITEIVEQGEGEITLPPSGEKFDPDHDLAHFYRFNELRHGRRYRFDDTPAKPTGDPIDVGFGAVYPMKPNLKAAELPTPELQAAANAFNATWTLLLEQVEVALRGAPGVLRAAVGTMFELKYAACDLLRIPLPGDPDGLHAGPTFEVTSKAARSTGRG